MRSKTRSRVISYNSHFAMSSGTFPAAPFKAVSTSGGRLVTAAPNAHTAGDRFEIIDETIADGEQYTSGYRTCLHTKERSLESISRLTAYNSSAVCQPPVLNESVARAIGNGNILPVSTRPVSTGFVATYPAEEAGLLELWETLRLRRAGAESALYAGLSEVSNDSAYLRSIFELKDNVQTVDSIKELFKFARAGYYKGYLPKSATVLEVARQYLTVQFGIRPTVSDTVRWCDKYLRQAPVKLLYRQPVEQGSTIRRAVTVDPLGSEMKPWSVHTTLPEYNQTISYDNPAIQGNYVDDYALYGSLVDWQGSGLRVRPYSRSRLKGVFFGRVAKSKLVLSLEELGLEEIYTLDRSIIRDMNPLRDFVLAYHPITTSWQLTPFSFLVDWFVNCGETIRRLENRLANVKRRLTFEEGIWLSIGEEQVVQYPKMTVDASVAHRMVSYNGSGFTYRKAGSVDVNVEWIGQVGRNTYQRGLTQAILGFEKNPLQGLKFDFKLNPYTLSAGAALIVTWLPLARVLKNFLRLGKAIESRIY